MRAFIRLALLVGLLATPAVAGETVVTLNEADDWSEPLFVEGQLYYPKSGFVVVLRAASGWSGNVELQICDKEEVADCSGNWVRAGGPYTGVGRWVDREHVGAWYRIGVPSGEAVSGTIEGMIRQ